MDIGLFSLWDTATADNSWLMGTCTFALVAAHRVAVVGHTVAVVEHMVVVVAHLVAVAEHMVVVVAHRVVVAEHMAAVAERMVVAVGHMAVEGTDSYWIDWGIDRFE